MSGRIRNRSKRESDRQIVRKQSGFIGGMNLDKPASEIQVNEVANLENMRAFIDRVETRSGSEKQANLPGSGTFHNYFYHSGNKQHIIHRGARLQIAGDISGGFVEAVGSKYPLDAASNVVALGRNIIIFQGSQMNICELQNSTGGFYNRLMNAANPDEPLDIKNPADETGPYIYRYLHTFVRRVDDVVIAESGTIVNKVTNLPNYTEISFNDPIGDGISPIIDSFTDPTEGTGSPLDATQWTDIRVYRTLDIGDQGSGDKETYYLVDTIEFDNVTDPANTILYFQVAVSAIGNLDAGLQASDSAILLQGNISKTRFVEPLPDGLVGAASPSFIFTATDTDPILRYSSTGDVPERAGYFFPGNQFQQLDDGIKAIYTSADTVAVFCNSSTYAGSTKSLTNAGEQGLGQSIPLLGILDTVDDHIGITDTGSISTMDVGRLVAHCSDDSIRIWNGRNWEVRDWARNKVSSELRKIIGGSVGLYSPEGYYMLWYRTDTSDTRTTKCLRLGMEESIGLGWNFEIGTAWIFPPLTSGAVRCYDNANNKLQLYVIDDADAEIFWIDTYDGGTGSGLVRRNKDKNLESNQADIVCKIRFGEITGERESFTIIHQETYLDIRPLEREGSYPSGLNLDINIYKDDSSTIQATYIDLDSSDFASDIHFDRDIEGKRLSIEVVSDEDGWILVNYTTICRVQDKPSRDGASTDSPFDQQASLASNLFFESGRPDPNLNILKTVASGDKTGTTVGTAPTRITGIDTKANTAFSFTGS